MMCRLRARPLQNGLASRACAQKTWYDNNMDMWSGLPSDDSRLREIAAILRRAYALKPIDPPTSPADFVMADMLVALDNPELCDILGEIREMHLAQLQRLERLLSRYADNDT